MEDSQKKRQALAQAGKGKLGLNGRIIVGNLLVEHQPTKQTKAICSSPAVSFGSRAWFLHRFAFCNFLQDLARLMPLNFGRQLIVG